MTMWIGADGDSDERSLGRRWGTLYLCYNTEEIVGLEIEISGTIMRDMVQIKALAEFTKGLGGKSTEGIRVNTKI